MMRELLSDMPVSLSSDKYAFLQDVYAGLARQQKALPCKYLYNERGSALFNAICETPEYYLTRTERDITRTHIFEISRIIGPRCLLIEYGAGNGEKIRMLLDHLPEPIGYIPIDISTNHLEKTVQALRHEYPLLNITSVNADFTQRFRLPHVRRVPKKKVVYFPGSTIGNFNPVLGVRLLRDMRRLLNKGDGLLIGIDLKKDTAILNRAYNDKTGLTEAFNKNIILRINEELEGTFNPHSFAHKAFYNPRQGRMEMHLVSLVPQRVHVRQRGFYFRQNESIHTESSYKYTIDEFAELSCRGGFKIKLFWKDDQDWFAVLYLEAT